MSLYKDASLVMIPSAVKDGKLYSIRPTPEYGAELVTNGDFATDSDWGKNSNWTISGGAANCDGTSNADMNQAFAATIGKTYNIILEITSISQGGVSAKVGGSSTPYYTSVGTHSIDVTATSTDRIRMQGNSSPIGSITLVSVKEVITADGDFTFSRGSNLAATRVDVNGLIEKGRENLAIYSNDFSNAIWNASAGSVFTSSQAGYDGTNNAWKLAAGGSGTMQIVQTTSNTSIKSHSIYAKSGSVSTLKIWVGSTKEFNLSAGTTSSSNSIITNVGGGWYRCEVFNVFSNLNPFFTAASAGDYIYVQNAQLEQGLVATDYIETGASTAQSGILEDLPRLDYSGGASCPALLLEPLRSNHLNHGEYFGAWSLQGNGTGSAPVLAANTTDTLSPEGKYNAYKVTFDAGSGTTSSDESIMYRSKSGLTAGSDHTASVYLKGETGGEEVIVRDTAGSYKKWTLTTEWARYDYTQVAVASSYATSLGVRQGLGGIGTINSNAVVYIYGFQSETGSYPTSYIPTYGSAVTRSKDFMNEQISGLTSITQGTFFLDFDRGLTNSTSRDASTDGFNYRSTSSFPSANAIEIASESNGGVRVAIRTPQGFLGSLYNNNTLSRFKVLLKWNGAEVKAFVNGVNTYTSATKWGEMTEPLEYIGYNASFRKSMNQVLTFPTALTDSECIALTTI
jgi:hypothetical protein